MPSLLDSFAAICVSSLVYLMVRQGAMLRGVRIAYRDAVEAFESVGTRYQPKAAICVSVRGCDPGLHACLQALATQDYREYELIVVVDSEMDPAWSVANEVLREYPHCQSLVLNNPAQNCSLKCSSILQALDNVSADFDVVTICDTDANIPPDWLARLVSPLCDPDVEVSTGIRWFIAARGIGGTMRYFWNGLCNSVMFAHRMPWGGSMAIRRSFVERTKLKETFATSLVDDITTGAMAAETKAKIVVARVATVCDERVHWRGFLTYGSRQLTYARLYDPGWKSILFSTVAATSAYVGVIGTAIAYWQIGATVLSALAAGVLATYWLGLCLGLARGNRTYNPSEHHTANTVDWVVAVLFSQLLLFWFVCAARAKRGIMWRGIRYDVSSGNGVRMVSICRMYLPTAKQPASSKRISAKRVPACREAPETRLGRRVVEA